MTEKDLEKPLEDAAKDIDDKPLEVIVKNQPKEKEEINPTSYDTKDEWDIELSEEEIKEMTDAQ